MGTLLIDIGNTRIKWALLRGANSGRQQALPLADWRGFERAVRRLRRVEAVLVICVAGARGTRVARRTAARRPAEAPVRAQQRSACRRHQWLS
jgi:pantothenate kinase type III